VTKLRSKFVILLFAAAVLTTALYFFDFRSREKSPEITVENPVSATPTEEEPQPKSPAPPLASIEKPLPKYTGQPPRELNADPKFVASIGEALFEKYQKNLISIAERLEKNPANSDGWFAVAYIKKLFNNYIGTRDAWEYAKVVNPENPIAYFNLGELYGYEFKEPVKAEENYKSALRLNPYHLDYYIGLANFYKDVVKRPEKAEATLLSALEKIPHTEPNLFAAIGAFYRDQKNYTQAIEYFEKALNAAGSPAVKKPIQDEINYIRSKQ
jgi:tetratricopeptide (TPR) repeat protein